MNAIAAAPPWPPEESPNDPRSRWPKLAARVGLPRLGDRVGLCEGADDDLFGHETRHQGRGRVVVAEAGRREHRGNARRHLVVQTVGHGHMTHWVRPGHRHRHQRPHDDHGHNDDFAGSQHECPDAQTDRHPQVSQVRAQFGGSTSINGPERTSRNAVRRSSRPAPRTRSTLDRYIAKMTVPAWSGKNAPASST
jgi:hypothetical protein